MEEDRGNSNLPRGGGKGGGEEEEGVETLTQPVVEGGDPEWVDITSEAEEANGREAMGRTRPTPRLGRTSPDKDAGRLQGGRGKRGFWVSRREKQLGKSKVTTVKGS